MRAVIVAKTRRGSGACVGALARDGRSLRLVAADADRNQHAGLEYQVGEVWEIECAPDLSPVPPHVENVIVYSARRVGAAANLEAIIRRFMPPVGGGPEALFDGRLQRLPSGGLYIAARTGLPAHSTMFWTPDRPLEMDCEGKRIRYRYSAPDGGRLLTYVGFQDPIPVIPAGALVRVSLAHWWRPPDKPEEELRCHVQLSGWFLPPEPAASGEVETAPRDREPDRAAATPVPDLALARQTLKRTFGFTEFLPLQEAIVRRVLERRDTLVIMPTGGGKSLCYQLPALLIEGLTVVVSPLIALMQDQVSQLRELDVGAAFLNSTLSYAEYAGTARRIRSGEVRILYVAPETLLRPETLVLIEQSRAACFAVDEAHCISEWGHDFRPEYRQIQAARQRFPAAVCVALTATATPRVREDIRRLLGIEPAGEFVASFDRPNLFLAAQPRHDGLGQTLAFLESHRDRAGILYCSTRKQVDDLAAELQARGWPALPYHAGLPNDERQRNQDRFIRDDATLMVATVAFGLGIDKSNVRFVLHYQLPKDLESYYQEVGRAGRDGLPADCLLLHSRADAVTIRRFIEEGAASERPGRQARLDALMRYAQTTGCRRAPLLAYFGETHSGACGHCDNCRAAPDPADLADVTVAAQKFLSCVKRTGELFGPAHIIDVLRGSRSQRIVERGHDRLSTHGIGAELSKEEWRELAGRFLEQGLVEQDLQYGGLRLTAKAWPVLKGAKVFAPRLASTPAPAAPAPALAMPAAHDRALFEELRRLRRQLADAANVPAYVVFSDRALTEMAARLPQNAGQFLAVNGVGEAKLAKYGETFLATIRQFCAARGIDPAHGEPANAPAPPEPPATRWVTALRRCERIAEAFAAGRTLDELTAQFGIRRSTALDHLARFVDQGGRLDPARLLAESRLSPAERERAVAAFAKLGLDRLAPVREALGAAVSYDELHLLRLSLRCQGTS